METTIPFYDLKTRKHVDVPLSSVTKRTMTRATKTGEQTRYSLKATHEGSNLTKFVNKATFDATDVPVV